MRKGISYLDLPIGRVIVMFLHNRVLGECLPTNGRYRIDLSLCTSAQSTGI